MKYLLLFTHFCRDKISSLEELTTVKKTRKEDVRIFHPGMRFYDERWANFYLILEAWLNILFNFDMFEHNES